MNMNGMNDTVKGAWDKLHDRRTDRVSIEELTGYATRAFFNFGPFSSVSISNRMNLWSYMTQKCFYLDDREKRALFYWLCQEPDRMKEGEG
jgi:hypothetical protein